MTHAIKGESERERERDKGMSERTSFDVENYFSFHSV